MNQILVINNSSIYNGITYKKIKNYLFLFFISISICILIFFYFLNSSLEKLNETQKSDLLIDKYNISTLYNSNTNYRTLKLSNNISIIGLIDIPKINVSYSIIENTDEDLLKISVCRFAGPLPNRIGNLCIAGHNYKNNLMFSKLYKLKLGDCIYITDLNNTKLEYIIYDRFIVNENNLDCMQASNNVEITLITCNSTDNSERLVIKAKMKG